MESRCWLKLIMEERLDRRKHTWMKQNAKWMEKWKISMHEFPDNNEGIKKFISEKFRSIIWSKKMV